MTARDWGVPFLFLKNEREDFDTETTEGPQSTQRREEKTGTPKSTGCGTHGFILYFLCFLYLIYFTLLLVFLVDVEDGAVFVEGYVEGFGLFDEDVGELVFLG